jgi:hypothetical protein
VTERVLRLAVLVVSALLAAMPSHAQTSSPSPASAVSPPPQPFTGFVSSYEIVHTLRSAGFNPLAPPLREGTTYVVRATDYRGVLMRVVVDARTGAIRDANRIVPGPGRFGQYYDAPSPYDPADLDAAMAPPGEDGMEPPLARPALARPAVTAPGLTLPPLPRPRPAALASRRPDVGRSPKAPPPLDAKPDAKSEAKSDSPKPDAKPAPGDVDAGAVHGADHGSEHGAVAAKPNGVPDARPEINSQIITAAPPRATAPHSAPAAVAPLND